MNNSNQEELPFLASKDISLKTTPMFQQYLMIKSEYQECLLFFRMGDFYELFFEDAITAANELDIVLTSRGQYDGEPVPMCGVPFHAYVPYLQKLTKRGYKVAICEQTENPEEAKKRGGYKAIVRREVIRVVTPGTLIEDVLLQPKNNNFLTSIKLLNNDYGLSWIDISIGDLYTQSCKEGELLTALATIRPREILLAEEIISENKKLTTMIDNKLTATISPLTVNITNIKKLKKLICMYFNVKSLDSFGSFSDCEIGACWSLLEYIKLTQKVNLPPIRFPKSIKTESNMQIDPFTRKSLEISETLHGERKGSLLYAIDRTLTAAGARQLDKDISSPLTSVEKIERRLVMLECLYKNKTIKENLRELLKNSADIGRAKARIISGRGDPKDLLSIKMGIITGKKLKKEFQNSIQEKEKKDFDNIINFLGSCDKLHGVLNDAIAKKLPSNSSEGGFIAEGYSSKLDKLRELRNESRKYILELETKEKNIVGIPTLKIKYNNILGHFFELTQLQKEKFIKTKDYERFIPRQSLKGVARFTTEKLSKLSESINNAAQQSLEIELKIFEELKEIVYENSENLSNISESIARIDVLSSLADLAMENQYVKPQIVKESLLEVEAGRHPTIELALQHMGENSFCSNDCLLEFKDRIWLLTGPNMAGKSTFLRQNAIITILAQSGSFVPANKAKIGIVDKLFSRVGAADDLGSGRSTFMVEMIETAAILNQATKNSLVIMDEVGRGTSTYDGLSIAWSILEHLHNVNNCRTLFATHYHELTKLENSLTALSCHTMKVKEWKRKVIFLYTVVKGSANESYGIHVADLAGIPDEVLIRAKNILQNFEDKNKEKLSFKENNSDKYDKNNQYKFLDLVKEIASLDPNSLSPKQALELLYDYVSRATTIKKRKQK